MGVLNNTLGLNVTIYDPLVVSPFNENVSLGYVVPPPGSEYMISEDGKFMETEAGNNLMITE
jgi:hypothetical protein